MSHGESREAVDHSGDLSCDEIQRIPLDQDVCVADDVLAGGAEMNDARGLGDAISKRMNVCHHVVAKIPFVLLRGLEIDVVQRGTQAIDLRGIDGQPQLLLGFRECQPDSTPISELATCREDDPHVGGSVSSLQWGPISPMSVRNTVNVSGLRLVHSFNWRSGTSLRVARKECYRPDRDSTSLWGEFDIGNPQWLAV